MAAIAKQRGSQLPLSEMTNEQLAALANKHSMAFLGQIRGAIQKHALVAGQALNEMKSRLEHGEWSQWLAENFEGSKETARAYMRIAANWERIAGRGWDEECKTLEQLLERLRPKLSAHLKRLISERVEACHSSTLSIQFSDEDDDPYEDEQEAEICEDEEDYQDDQDDDDEQEDYQETKPKKRRQAKTAPQQSEQPAEQSPPGELTLRYPPEVHEQLMLKLKRLIEVYGTNTLEDAILQAVNRAYDMSFLTASALLMKPDDSPEQSY